MSEKARLGFKRYLHGMGLSSTDARWNEPSSGPYWSGVAIASRIEDRILRQLLLKWSECRVRSNETSTDFVEELCAEYA